MNSRNAVLRILHQIDSTFNVDSVCEKQLAFFTACFVQRVVRRSVSIIPPDKVMLQAKTLVNTCRLMFREGMLEMMLTYSDTCLKNSTPPMYDFNQCLSHVKTLLPAGIKVSVSYIHYLCHILECMMAEILSLCRLVCLQEGVYLIRSVHLERALREDPEWKWFLDSNCMVLTRHTPRLLPKKSFNRLVRKLCSALEKDVKISPKVFSLLYVFVEHFVSSFLQKCERMATHYGRGRITRKDVDFLADTLFKVNPVCLNNV